MLRWLVCLLLLILIVSCQDTKEGLVSRSTIRSYNRITVVISDSLWQCNVGDSIRQYLASSVEGIRPNEPIFTLDQIPKSLFVNKELLRKNVILFEIGDVKKDILFEKDKFVQAQNYFELKADNPDAMISLFKENVESIINVIHDFEISEIQNSLKNGKTHDDIFLKTRFGIELDIPIEYERVLSQDKFVWYKMDIASGNSNLLIYELPYEEIIESLNPTEFKDYLLKSKDSVVAKYVRSSEDGCSMKVDGDIYIYKKKLNLDNRPTIELKGSWDMTNSFMDGPFICYSIKDEEKKRLIFLDGFTYNPSINKRDILLELEAIFRTLKFD